MDLLILPIFLDLCKKNDFVPPVGTGNPLALAMATLHSAPRTKAAWRNW